MRPGYKRTEVGVIPREWDVVRIGDVASVRTGPFGSALHERDYVEDGTPIITVEHLGEFGVTHDNPPKVSNADRQRLGAYVLEEDDLVFSRVGSIDRNALISSTEAGWLFSGRLLRIRPDSGRVVSAYLSYHFHSEPFKQRVRSVAVGQTMLSLNTEIIRGVTVVLPTLDEQRAIAAALRDVDALISSLDKLIAKKRDIKQAAMQQLLTGKCRLPGFGGPWKTWTFGELFKFLRTGSNPRGDLSESADVGYVHYGDIHTHTSAFLDCEATLLPRIAYEKVSSLPLLETGDLVMVDASEDYAGIGKCVELCNVEGSMVVAGLHTILLRGDREKVADGFKGYLQFIPHVKKAMIRLATGISVYGVSKNNVKTIEVSLPEVGEQRAIASVLSDMDAEIEALERRRDKTRLLKQGMMQELLTGRVRLV